MNLRTQIGRSRKNVEPNEKSSYFRHIIMFNRMNMRDFQKWPKQILKEAELLRV